jgi:hypothetical protein
MSIKEKYLELRRILALTLALTSSQVVLPAVVQSTEGDKKDQKRVESKNNGMTLSNASESDLFSLSMKIAKAEDNIDVEAEVEKMYKDIEEKYGKIAPKSAVKNLFLFINGCLSRNEEDKEAVLEAQRLWMNLSVRNANRKEKFFDISKYVKDEYLREELHKGLVIVRGVVEKPNKDTKQAFAENAKRVHADRLVYFTREAAYILSVYENIAGQNNLNIGDSFIIDGEPFDWVRFSMVVGKDEVLFIWYKGDKFISTCATNNELAGKIVRVSVLDRMVDNGEAEKEGLVNTIEQAYLQSIGAPIDQNCLDQSSENYSKVKNQ